MKKQINDLLLKMQTGESCIGETANKLLRLFNVDESHRDTKSTQEAAMEWWRELSIHNKSRYYLLTFDTKLNKEPTTDEKMEVYQKYGKAINKVTENRIDEARGWQRKSTKRQKAKHTLLVYGNFQETPKVTKIHNKQPFFIKINKNIMKPIEVEALRWWDRLSHPQKSKFFYLAFSKDLATTIISLGDLTKLYKMYSSIPKPPIGLLPQREWESQRADDIFAAMVRFKEKNQPIPIEWIEEYNTLADRLSP